MYEGRDAPGDRIGSIQGLKRMMCPEISEDPDDTEAAGPEERDDHRQDAVAQSAQFTAEDVHDPAETVGSHDDLHPEQSVFDHGAFCGVEPQEFPAEEVERVSHDQPNSGHQDETGDEDAV